MNLNNQMIISLMKGMLNKKMALNHLLSWAVVDVNKNIREQQRIFGQGKFVLSQKSRKIQYSR
jgi:hypothetical protein